jgi:hypothetical protein
VLTSDDAPYAGDVLAPNQAVVLRD